MYGLGTVRPGAEVEPGTNLLVAGPPMTGKRRLAMEVLAHGSRRGDGAIVVATGDGGEAVRASFRETLGREPTAPFGVIDCVSKQRGTATSDVGDVVYASSPVDMTGIGIELSELLQSFYDDRDVRRNRILLDSLSTLLMYSDLQTVFRFLHVLTGRVQSADALGVFVVDSTAHDEQAMSTLRQLFDGELAVREADDGGTECRLTGVGAETDWRPLDRD